jgi:hypothetical protein
MSLQTGAPPPAAVRGLPLSAVLVLITAVYGCAIYANLAFTVKDAAYYRFFPPFKRNANANMNGHLGGEYFNIARSMVNGEGFANPFDGSTGPTAWMPPLLPTILAGLLWVCDGDRDTVMAIVVFVQVMVLIGTGILVLALARQTTRLWAAVPVTVFLVTLLCNFQLCFQSTHDCWLVLLFVDLLIAGLCWLRPLDRGRTAAVWGLFGGLCALVNPIVALTWGTFSLVVGFQARAWSRLAIALLFAGLTLTPWTVRNYLVFGRLIPVKSNLAYELYQSQCLQKDGLIQATTFSIHPYGSNTRERKEYAALGEIAFLDRKREQFWEAVWADPQNFVTRAAYRFLGATLWYVPFDRPSEAKRPWTLWLCRLTHPLPFLALLTLVVSACWQRLHRAQWIALAVYLCYLLPYIVVSYYDRYAVPLLGTKVLLVVWAADRLLSFRFRGSTRCGQQGRSLRPTRSRVVASVAPA